VCYKEFDRIISQYGIEKIKTIGDSYMAAAGLPAANPNHAYEMVMAALDITEYMKRHKKEREGNGKPVFEIRVGIHTGPVVAGIVGSKKFAYDIWGDAVNLASRMESACEIGHINISGSTYKLIKDRFQCRHRGEIEAKNKGLVDMYYVDGLA
jgi:class 3 adenylate cyclase